MAIFGISYSWIFDQQQIGEIFQSENRCLKIHNVIQSPSQQIGQSETNLEEHHLFRLDFYPAVSLRTLSLNFLLFISCWKQVLMLLRSRRVGEAASFVGAGAESFSVIGKLVATPAAPFVGQKLINGKFYIINPNFATKGQIINLNLQQMPFKSCFYDLMNDILV